MWGPTYRSCCRPTLFDLSVSPCRAARRRTSINRRVTPSDNSNKYSTKRLSNNICGSLLEWCGCHLILGVERMWGLSVRSSRLWRRRVTPMKWTSRVELTPDGNEPIIYDIWRLSSITIVQTVQRRYPHWRLSVQQNPRVRNAEHRW